MSLAEMVKEVCFSSRTSQLALVKSIAAVLLMYGMESFFQEDISLTGANWQAQWYRAAKLASKIVAILTTDYALSEPCCEEFGVAKNNKKLIVIYKDPMSSISDVAPNDFNGAVLMYVENQNQGLPPNDVEFIARQIFKAIRGSDPVAVTTSPVPAPAAPSTAAITAQLSAVTILANAAVIDDATKKHGANPLVKVAEMGDEGTVISLVKAGYKDLEEKLEGGSETALMKCAANGLEGAVKVLLAAGANKDAQSNVSSR